MIKTLQSKVSELESLDSLESSVLKLLAQFTLPLNFIFQGLTYSSGLNFILRNCIRGKV